MGKYRRYKNRVEMFLSSERGKRVLNFCYSWGASVIVIGAMFKIVHLPYANTILCVSLIFESLVFFISAFERPSNEYNWEEVFPVLKSKNPLDRPDFVSGGFGGNTVIVGDGTANPGGGGTLVIGNLGGGAQDVASGTGGDGRIAGGAQDVASGMGSDGRIANGSYAGGGVSYVQARSPQNIVNAGMATMGLNISEKDSEVLAESIKKLNSAAEQISKMADLTEATQTYIDQMSTVSHNLEKFNEITGSLGEVSDTLINSCKTISGVTEESTEETPKSYVENMSRLNENLSGLNHFYETQLSGLRSQMDTILHINAGLNRIRDMYDSSIVDSAAFRNENERMAQLLSQLNQVYGRLLQAMTVNVQAGGYPPPAAAGSPGYQQPPYQGYPPQGGYR
ncbi:MAG: gliding motility protein GldL [Tannerella sp.]|jgi:gliding motility-associated protein GldL|nr:gliding motility protein GldL [Tannerella sp.]